MAADSQPNTAEETRRPVPLGTSESQPLPPVRTAAATASLTSRKHAAEGEGNAQLASALQAVQNRHQALQAAVRDSRAQPEPEQLVAVAADQAQPEGAHGDTSARSESAPADPERQRRTAQAATVQAQLADTRAELALARSQAETSHLALVAATQAHANENAQLSQRLAALSQQEANLQNSLCTLEAQAAAQAERHAAELAEVRAHASLQAQRHAERFTQLRAHAVTQVRQDAQQRAALIAELEARDQHTQQLHQALEAAQAALAQVESERAEAEAHLAERDQQLAEEARRAADHAQREAQATAERQALAATAAAAQNEADRLRTTLAEQQPQLEALRQQLSAQDQQLSAQAQQLAALAAQVSEQIGDAELRAQAEREASERFEGERERLQAAFDCLRAESAAHEERERQFSEKAQAEVQRALQRELALEATQGQVTELQAQLAATRAELVTLRASRSQSLAPQPTAVKRTPDGCHDPAPVAKPEAERYRLEPATETQANGNGSTEVEAFEAASTEPVPHQPLADVANGHAASAAGANPALETPKHLIEQTGRLVQVDFDEHWPGASTAACAHLGLATDPDTRHAFASVLNRCYRLGGADPVGPDHQANYCLGAEHGACPVYTGAMRHPRLPIDTGAENRQRRGLGRRLFGNRGHGKNGEG